MSGLVERYDSERRRIGGLRQLACDRLRGAAWVQPSVIMTADSGSLRAMASALRTAATAIEAVARAIDGDRP